MALAVTQHTCATQAVSSGLVNVLLPCLTQGSLSLACATLEALMQITIAVQGKQAMVRVTQCDNWIFVFSRQLDIQFSESANSCLVAYLESLQSSSSIEQTKADAMRGDIPCGHLARHKSLRHR